MSETIIEVAVVDHEHGCNVYGAMTTEKLNEQVLDYVKEWKGTDIASYFEDGEEGLTYSQVHVPKMIDEGIVITALCVWEEINEVTILSEERTNTNWCKFHEDVGSFELRHQSIRLAMWIEEIWALVPEDAQEAHAFDWEFVPACLGPLLVWRDGSYEMPPAAETAAKYTAMIRDADFEREAERIFIERLGLTFTDIGVDVAVLKKQASDLEMSADEFVTWWRDKYDLEEISR